MSLHAEPKPEALDRLRKRKRNSTISSFVIAFLLVAIIAISLGIFLLPGISTDREIIVTYTGPGSEMEQPEPTKITTRIQRNPSAPSSSPVRVIVANSVSPVSIPVPEVSSEVTSVEFGTGNDFGSGWEGDGYGKGGGGSMFGSKDSIPGALKGRLYDFKQNRRGKEISYDSGAQNYAGIARKVEDDRFGASAFSDYFQAPIELSLTNLAIAYVSADMGPEYFGAKDTIKPSGWMAVYQGRITAPATGRFRFRAASDDYLVVLINNRRNLLACWDDLQNELAERWKPGKQEGSTESPLGSARLHAGHWIDLRAGQPVDITLAVGERPGGQVGFLLEVEQEGEEYRTADNGRKILPLFTTHPFSPSEQEEIQDRFGAYEFEWENVPVFGIK